MSEQAPPPLPDARVVRRDLAATPLPHIEQETITGYYTPADQMTDDLRRATALSDALIAELTAADVVILTVPMYNFSIPSALKAYNAENTGSSRHVRRVRLMAVPPSMDAGEITDKGYVNQRKSLETRRADVEALFRDPPGADVMVF